MPCPLEQRYKITVPEFVKLIDDNPSLRGMVTGYVAEFHFEKMHLDDSRFTKVCKDDDHDRKKKGDRRFEYRGHEFIVEAKSLQTKSCKKLGEDEWSGSAQVDGSDKRVVVFEDGSTVETTLLKRGEFDVLAVNCFAFGGDDFRFVFAKNADLPFSKAKKYSPQQQEQLVRSTVAVTWPPQAPFDTSLTDLLDEIILERESAAKY